MERGVVTSLNTSAGGVPKLPRPEAFVSVHGMEGDRQRDRRFHGGPDRALCLYSLELIDQLAMEGHHIVAGSTGENVTISGLDWALMLPGARLRIGEVEAQITSFTVPCKNIRHSFLNEEFTRISEKIHPGWSRVYARVIAEGTIRVDDPVSIG